MVGAGPAGRALAAEAAEAGLAVTLVDPTPDHPWPANYGLWGDEAQSLDLPLSAAWSRPRVHVGGETRVLSRTYGQLDKDALQERLRARGRKAGVRVVSDRAAAVTHGAEGSTLTCEGGAALDAWLVCDCSGHRPVLVARTPAEPSAFQTAWGELLEVEHHPWGAEEAVFMDFRRDHLAPDEGGPPTFLYAMPFGPRRVFVEETALAARPMLSREILRDRLHRRLAAMGIRSGPPLETEWCVIPMDAAIPPPQRVLALGGAAGMVHPATGYSVVSSLAIAPALAAALLRAREDDLPPDRAAARGWEVVWSPGRRALWRVLCFGREAMLDLDPDDTDRFFATFFAMPTERWAPFLGGTDTAREVGGTMLHMFSRAPAALRLRLATAAFGSAGLAAVAAMLRSPTLSTPTIRG